MAGLVPVQPVFYLVLLLLFSSVARAEQHTPQQRQHYALPAQPLAAALLQFARQVNKPLLFDPAKLAGLQAPAVTGEFSADEVLQKLLAEQPLDAIPRVSGWLIKAKPVAEQSVTAAVTPVAPSLVSAPAMEVIAVRANGGQYRHSSATAQLPGATALKRQTLFAQDSLVA